MQSWGEFSVGDIVEVVNYTVNWDGTIGRIEEIKELDNHITCRLHYIKTAELAKSYEGRTEEKPGWYLDDGHIRKVRDEGFENDLYDRTRYWQKFFEGEK